MKRVIAYPSEQMLVEDFLTIQVSSMKDIGRLVQAVTGGSNVVDGIDCTPTSPATMAVNLSAGTLFYPTIVDVSSFSVLPPDSSYLMKVADFAGVTMPIPTVSGVGQEIVYLIQASASEPDDTPTALNYFDAANTAITLSGPNGSGTAQNTRRTSYCNVSLKAGAPAPAGTATSPATDPGSVPLWLVTVEYGQTTISAGNITPAPNAPRFHSRLTNALTASDLTPYALQSALVAEIAARTAAEAAETLARTSDVTALSTSLSAETTARTSADTAINARIDALPVRFSALRTYGANDTFTVPAGVHVIKIHCSGAGGGGGASGSSNAGGGGGGGGTAIGYYSVTPGDTLPITVGSGGNGGIVGGDGGTGGTSSVGSLISASGGTGGGGGNGSSAGGSGGSGFGGQLGIVGGYGGDGSTSGLTKGGEGATSFWGGGGRAATSAGIEELGEAYGSGGGAGYFSPNVSGGPGQIGVVVIEF